MNIRQYQKRTCRYCDAPLPQSFLDLGDSPLANSLVPKDEADRKEFQCPLSLTRCLQCGLVQLTHVVPPDLLFAHYLYVSSTTQTFRQHFADYAKEVSAKLIKKEDALAVDIGSNDGLLLSCYQKEGLWAVGVDPAKNLCEEANKHGLKTINRYFDSACVSEIIRDFGHADVVSANNVFAHIDDIQGVCRNVHTLLDPQGMFVIEFPYLRVMMEELLFDMIYHEHLSYIALHPLRYILNKYGLEIFDVHPVSSHGGSLRVFSQKKNGPHKVSPVVEEFLAGEVQGGYLAEPVYEKFAQDVMRVKKELTGYVKGIRAEGKKISGYGAPAKATTLINFCRFHADEIDYIVDDNPLKQDHLVPGSKIPIVPSSYLEKHPTDYVIIFAWNFAREIIAKNEPLKKKGVRFIVPLPKPKIFS